MNEKAIMVKEPHIIRGRIGWQFRKVSREDAVRWARILWNAPGLKALPEKRRAEHIRFNFIRGTLVTMDEMRRRP